MCKYNSFLDIKDEVKTALAEHRAVVALESTIISHGMPYPQNVEWQKIVSGSYGKPVLFLQRLLLSTGE